MQKDNSRRRFPLADRTIEVVDETQTGEVLLDEALKMMKSSEKMSVSSWIDLMSGASKYTASWFILTADRRDMESDEDWVPAQTSTRTTCQRSSR